MRQIRISKKLVCSGAAQCMEYVHLLVIFYIKNFLTFLRLVSFVYNSTFHYQNFFMAKEIIHFFKLHDERKKNQEILALDFLHRVEKSQNGCKT